MEILERNRFAAPILFTLLSLLILWPMLLPGYVLTLDMVWAPEMQPHWSEEAFNNAYPTWALIYLFTLALPSWVVQKIVLFALFFLLFFMPWRFLPFIEGAPARLAAAGVYALNPFVYARMLSGQWMHLMGYALLPFLLFALVRLTRRPDWHGALLLFSALALIGFFSLHFLYLSLILSAVWMLVWCVRALARRRFLTAARIGWFGGAALLALILLSLYWLVPALAREAPLETRFDATHFDAYAASENGELGVYANLAVLGGFWAEGNAWRYYFSWPQESPLFWYAAGVLAPFILLGALLMLVRPATRPYALMLIAVAGASYALALGAADTPLRMLNLWLYEHLPGYSGLRDSHKIAGFLALCYALFAGVGVHALLANLARTSANRAVMVGFLILLLPMSLGLYHWGGFGRQLTPTWYPPAWHAAKAALIEVPEEEKVLVLPWHGYLSLDFADQLIVANPAPRFFGRDRVVASRSTDLGALLDQEADPRYRALDRAIRSAEVLSVERLREHLKEHQIAYALVITNAAFDDWEAQLTSWQVPTGAAAGVAEQKAARSASALLELLDTQDIVSGSVVLRHITPQK